MAINHPSLHLALKAFCPNLGKIRTVEPPDIKTTLLTRKLDLEGLRNLPQITKLVTGRGRILNSLSSENIFLFFFPLEVSLCFYLPVSFNYSGLKTFLIKKKIHFTSESNTHTHPYTICCAVLSCFDRIWLCDPRTVAHQALVSMGILQARILEWVTMPSSRGSSPPRDQTCVSCIFCIADGFYTTEPLRKPLYIHTYIHKSETKV